MLFGSKTTIQTLENFKFTPTVNGLSCISKLIVCLWVLQADLRLQFMCQTQMNSVLNTDSKWRPKLQKTIAFNHYTVGDTRVCVCACVRMLGVFIFEQIGCSNTAHFAFKTHHVP